MADSAFADFGTMTKPRFRHLPGLPSLFAPGALALGGCLTGQRLANVSPLAAAAGLIGAGAPHVKTPLAADWLQAAS